MVYKQDRVDGLSLSVSTPSKQNHLWHPRQSKHRRAVRSTTTVEAILLRVP